MEYIVTVTKQGQISIPAEFRKLLDLDKLKKAIVSLKAKKIIVEPTNDFLLLKGSLKTKKKIPSKKTRAAFLDYLATRFQSQ